MVKAITAAIGAVTDTLVKQAVELATETIGERVQKLLRYEQDRLEQYSWRETIRITGIHSNGEETNEQLTEKVIKVLKECQKLIFLCVIVLGHLTWDVGVVMASGLCSADLSHVSTKRT